MIKYKGIWLTCDNEDTNDGCWKENHYCEKTYPNCIGDAKKDGWIITKTKTLCPACASIPKKTDNESEKHD